MPRPQTDEYPPSFESYIALVKYESVSELIATFSEGLIQFVENLPDAKANYAYAPGKWTVKEVLQHVLDMERVFAYRALVIARGEQQPLPGANHEHYYLAQRSKNRAFEDMKEEFRAMRYSHNILFRSFDKEALGARGNVLGNSTTCKSWIYASFGHTLHHVRNYQALYGIEGQI